MSSPDREDFGILLNLAFNEFRLGLHQALAEAGHPHIGPLYGYVFRLLDGGSCSLTELAAHLQMTAPGALKVVDDMVANGYVTRTSDAKDKRVKQLALTAKGRAALKLARHFHARYEKRLARQMGDRALADTRAVLEAIAAPAMAAERARPRPIQALAARRANP